ncbi:CLAVATA3/ESR (CLE)-related protein TDIF-like protein [Corchorus capsularis]|uniref:CLAVATA3/ESR (CLE)-related protein TDIF-like protein n=1 Tax=Corchorus capsularis TaxID=210143 RepID=A0A1R3J266_COCAP|nr:CLAVATA3/ESR (CLE)-related protein TDIF-like protein [Corchorus capsularis]
MNLHPKQTRKAHTSSPSSSSSKSSRREFGAEAHEVPSGPNPISNSVKLGGSDVILKKGHQLRLTRCGFDLRGIWEKFVGFFHGNRRTSASGSPDLGGPW